MSDSVFVDTNILVYSRDPADLRKQRIAASRLEELWTSQTGRLSVQVLNEHYVTVTRKLHPGLSAVEAWDDVEIYTAWNPLRIDMPLLARAQTGSTRYDLSWWDSLIVAAAEASGCTRILSEDLSDGATYFGVTVENPFAE